MSGERLTPAQKDSLSMLARGPRSGITDERIVKALARKGYAERYVDRIAHMTNAHGWRITPAGEAKHKAETR